MSNSALPPMIADLLQRLVEQTRAGRVDWHDASSSYSGESFRAHVGEGLVSVGATMRELIEHSESRLQRGYRAEVLNSVGKVVAELETFEGDPHYRLLKELIEAARLKARRGDQVIGQMLQALAR